MVVTKANCQALLPSNPTQFLCYGTSGMTLFLTHRLCIAQRYLNKTLPAHALCRNKLDSDMALPCYLFFSFTLRIFEAPVPLV